jgi:shikimate kinase
MSRPTVERIYLIGYRGAGKTSVARQLAGRLDWPWIDADEALETRVGQTIQSIFAKEGEPTFRELEAALLRRLCMEDHRIIATGGGVVLRGDNRAYIKKTGRVVWLTADAETLWQRLLKDLTTASRRPPLTIGGLAEVKELLQQRTPLYQECADLTIDTAGRTPDEIAATILHEFGMEQ